MPVGGTVIAHTAMSRLGWVTGGGPRARTVLDPHPVEYGLGEVTFPTLDWDTDDFPRLGADYLSAGGELAPGRVGLAAALLVPVVPLVDFAVGWFREHRR